MTNNLIRKTNKKESILEAAQKVFINVGYKKASITQIAQEAHASQVTLYKYFPSKIELGRAVVIKLIVDGYHAYGASLDNANKTFVEKMQDMMTNGVDLSNSINDDFVIFMYDEFNGKNNSNKVKQQYDSMKHAFWKKLLDQGRAEGVVDKNISDDIALIYLDMFINYSLYSGNKDSTDILKIKNHEDDIMHLFFYGLIGK